MQEWIHQHLCMMYVHVPYIAYNITDPVKSLSNKLELQAQLSELDD